MLLTRKNYIENYPMLCTTVLLYILVYSSYPIMLPLSNKELSVGQAPGTEENLEPERDREHGLCSVGKCHILIQ